MPRPNRSRSSRPRSPRRIARASRLCLALLLTLAAALPHALAAQEEAAPAASPLSVAEIVVEPSRPAADTLCRLTVKIANSGDKIASQLGFAVRLNGQDLGVYGNQLFMYPAAPGATSELKLYNFWTTETSRALPKDGKLVVEVELKEAQWMDISTDDEGVEVWSPLGEVEGLPVSTSITVQMDTGS